MTNPPVDVDPPLSLEPVVGWRTWGLDRVGGELTLRSVTRPDHWPAREAMVARCLQHRAGTVPEWRCTCGLYAMASPEQLVRSGVLAIGSGVVGTVCDVGTDHRVHVRTRSRFAYPARLRLVCGRCLALGAGAVTPVMVLGEHGSLAAVCEAHWSGPAARADPAAEVQAELLSTYGVELLPIEQLSGGLRAWPIDPTATRPCRDAATTHGDAFLSSRRQRPTARTPGGSSPACISSLVSSVASSNRPRGCVVGAARRDIVTFRTWVSIDVHDRCSDRPGDLRTERVVDGPAMGRCDAEVHRVVASLARARQLDRSVTGLTRQLALRNAAPPRRTARG